MFVGIIATEAKPKGSLSELSSIKPRTVYCAETASDVNNKASKVCNILIINVSY
jgi:hypothetical protein